MKYSVIISKPLEDGAQAVRAYLPRNPAKTLETILQGAQDAWRQYTGLLGSPYSLTGQPDSGLLEDTGGQRHGQGAGFFYLSEAATRLMSGIEHVLPAYSPWPQGTADGEAPTMEQRSVEHVQRRFWKFLFTVVHALQQDVDNPRAREVHAQYAERLAQHVLEKLLQNQPGHWQQTVPRGTHQPTYRTAAATYQKMVKKWLDVSANIEKRLSGLYAESSKRRRDLATRLLTTVPGSLWVRSDLLLVGPAEPSLLFVEPLPEAQPVEM